MSHKAWYHRIEASGIATIIGIIVLFSSAVAAVLIAPSFIEHSWIEPTSPFQVQMYTESDPYFYIGRSSVGVDSLEYVHHVQAGRTLLAFQESEQVKIQAPPELRRYITRTGEHPLKLTSRLLMLRPLKNGKTTPTEKATEIVSGDPTQTLSLTVPMESSDPQILELYEVGKQDAFATATSDDFLANYVDHDFEILDERPMQPFHQDAGVIYVKNPQEYRVTLYKVGTETRYRYDPNGKVIEDLAMLQAPPFGFLSRKELIHYGENIYKQEGCWYCHTDQTRTLIQDTVLNGTETYAAPPSSANEYIYQETSFLGTRRVGPDISRTGVKRPSRDWHKAHFWSPKTASIGSIMPAFRHLFTYDPRGTSNAVEGVPNVEFEALYQYLLTKGTRIQPPSSSWWTGNDPLHTTLIIEGMAVPNEP